MRKLRPAVLALCAISALVAPSGSAAQRAADLRPAGMGIAHHVPGPVTFDTAGARRATATPRRTVWRRFMFGGAALGAGTLVGYAVTNCRGTCRGDGGLSALPYYAGAAAVVGAAAGGLVGAVVDLARRQPSTAAAPSQ
jgi:hypothetical protein